MKCARKACTNKEQGFVHILDNSKYCASCAKLINKAYHLHRKSSTIQCDDLVVRHNSSTESMKSMGTLAK